MNMYREENTMLYIMENICLKKDSRIEKSEEISDFNPVTHTHIK